MKKCYTEEQIIKAIKVKVDDICRRLGISTGTFYNWRSKYVNKKRSYRIYRIYRIYRSEGL